MTCNNCGDHEEEYCVKCKVRKCYHPWKQTLFLNGVPSRPVTGCDEFQEEKAKGFILKQRCTKLCGCCKELQKLENDIKNNTSIHYQVGKVGIREIKYFGQTFILKEEK